MAKPDENAGSYLLCSNDWIDSQGIAMEETVQHFD